MTYEDFLISLSDISAEQAYKILNENPNHEHKSGYEFIIKKDPHWAAYYAKYIIKGRWIEAEEEYIKKDSRSAYYYAIHVIKGRWLEAEEYIKKDPIYAYWYAENIIKGRWIEAEEIIKNDPESAYNYAIHVIKGRWIEAEEIIKKDPEWANFYAKEVIKDDNFWDKRAALILLRESIKSEPTKPVEKTSSKDEIISALERLCS